MTAEKLHLKEVEKVIEKLRARCLGQDTPLTAILPTYAKEKDCRYQAKYIAAQLQFALAHAEGRYIPSKEHQRCRQWLEELICYLLEEIREDDHTFCQLVRLLGLPRETRKLVLYEFLPSDSELLSGEPPELLRSELDAAIWWLLGTQGKQIKGKYFLSTLYTFIASSEDSILES